jgi:uncharacterized protein with PIN domain
MKQVKALAPYFIFEPSPKLFDLSEYVENLHATDDLLITTTSSNITTDSGLSSKILKSTRKTERLQIEDIRNPDYWYNLYHNSDFWTCLYCGEKFLIKTSLKSHAIEHKDEKNYSLSQNCKDCGQYFPTFPLFSNHVKMTGHMNEDSFRSMKKNSFRESNKSYNQPNKFPLTSSIGFTNQTSILPSEYLDGLNYNTIYKKPINLCFIAVMNDSFVGEIAWVLLDPFSKIITQGSTQMKQLYPSLIRLEYEAFIQGLKAALIHHIYRINVITTSNTLIQQVSSGFSLKYIEEVIRVDHEIISAVNSLVSRFELLEFELISYGNTALAYQLVKDAIKNTSRLEAIKLDVNFDKNLNYVKTSPSRTLLPKSYF